MDQKWVVYSIDVILSFINEKATFNLMHSQQSKLLLNTDSNNVSRTVTMLLSITVNYLP